MQLIIVHFIQMAITKWLYCYTQKHIKIRIRNRKSY
jgi:hypothetical protein